MELTATPPRFGRRRYLVIGLALAALKMGLDQLVSRALRGTSWSLWNYLTWPFDVSLQAILTDAGESTFALVMFAVAVPFALVGVLLTARRLRDADLSPLWAILFLVPAANLALILVACAVPTARPIGAEELHRRPIEPAPRLPRSWVLLAASFAGAIVTFLGCVTAIVGGDFGIGVFFVAPAIGGLVASALVGLDGVGGLSRGLSAGLLSLCWCAAGILLLALDGLVCILMAMPLMIPLVFAGSLLGVALQGWFGGPRGVSRSAALLVLGGLGAVLAIRAEMLLRGPPPLRAVQTQRVVNADATRVWAEVVAFPSIPAPREWLFRIGIAYPTHATIAAAVGAEVGVESVRECVFSTGSFIEPITVWDPPHRLAFDVTAQPAPLRELSPYEVHPDHLDHHLTSRRGEFLLTDLPDRRTLLTGTTWYDVRMWPQAYWGNLCDAIIHRIHLRVLDHVRDGAERSTNGGT